MLKKPSEEDFAVLRGSFESGRQSPGALAGALLLSLFIHPLMFFLTHVVAGDATIFPHQDEVFLIHLWITIGLVILSVLYVVPRVYMKSQKIQYLLVILVSQNIAGVCCYLIAVFLIGEHEKINKESLMTFTYVTLLFGALIFIVTSIRFYILLRKDHYQKGSKKDELRGKFETKSYLSTIIVASTGLVFIIQYLIRAYDLEDIETMFMIILAMLIYFTMIFVLPEQLVMLYCKFRFDSFNYSKKGKLKPFNNQRKSARK